jgi:hypothetical protein
LEIHIKRRHGGVGQAIRNMTHDPMEFPGKPLSKNWRGDFANKFKPTNNIFSPSLETQRFILESARNMKEINDICLQLYGQQAPGLINATQTMNIGFSTSGTTLGFKGYVCEKCMSLEIAHIFDDVKRISSRPNHICNQQKLYEAQFVVDIQRTITKLRQELVGDLIIIVNNMMQQQELIDLAAVEITDSIFGKPPYEDCVDLDALQPGTPVDWARAAAKVGKIMINKIELAEFLATFEATLGFFRLKIDGTQRFFFTYIAKGLEPRDIEYLKNLYTTDANISNGIGGSIRKQASNIAENDMVQFVKAPFANEPIPMLRFNIFRASVNFQ